MNVRGKTEVVEIQLTGASMAAIPRCRRYVIRARLSATKAYGTAGMGHELVEGRVAP